MACLLYPPRGLVVGKRQGRFFHSTKPTVTGWFGFDAHLPAGRLNLGFDLSPGDLVEARALRVLAE